MDGSVRRLVVPSGFTTRFAPAPTGYLHLGHAANAVWVWGLAQAHAGRVLLRVEDHDRGRCRAEYEAALFEDLEWLGLAPDGASIADLRRGPHPQRQSDNTARYTARLAELEAQLLAYPCRCSRADIARATTQDDAEPRYPGTCRTNRVAPEATLARRVIMAADTPERFVDLRLGPQTQDPDAQCGDLLARDRLGNWTYQFAVTVDDLEQGVDLIVRGEDLLASTGRQLRLARMLGRSTAPAVLHHPLLLRPDGSKLSKSSHDTGLRELRAAGISREVVLGLAAQLGGLQSIPTPIPPDRLGDLFR